MTEKRARRGLYDLAMEAMEGQTYGPPVPPNAALLLGPLGCPECGATMFDLGDGTICCVAPRCSLYRLPFRRPTVPLERAGERHAPEARPYEDFRAELAAEGVIRTGSGASDLVLTLASYIGEECRLCGRELTADDVAEATWAGDRSGQRLCAMAHRRCWNGFVEVAADLGFDARAAVARFYALEGRRP